MDKWVWVSLWVNLWTTCGQPTPSPPAVPPVEWGLRLIFPHFLAQGVFKTLFINIRFLVLAIGTVLS